MKIKDLLENAVGYIAKNKKEASDPRYSMSVTQDIKPNEVARQAKKFGNTFPPPIIHSKAAKNSTPNKLMNLGLTESPIDKLKSQVVKQVNATDDEKLLDTVYTVLNKSNLKDRIQDVITNETDVGKYSAIIADAIINTPGSYQDKFDFINAYPKGYIDANKVISGKLVTFNELIEGGEFAMNVFKKLFEFKPGSAGPGEFALAALSPNIKMRSKGDLYINNKYIEVKTSAGSEVSSGGGRLGEPGLLNHNGVKEIIEKYTRTKLGDVDIYIHYLNQVLSSSIDDPKVLKKAVTEIITLIFGQNEPELINAIIKDNNVQQAYANANWEKYQKESGWAGLLLMNLSGQSLRYFTSPDQLFGNIYGLRALIVSKDHAKASRQILSQVTLKGSGGSAKSAVTDIANKIDTTSKPSTNKEVLPKRKPADITATKPRLNPSPKGVGRSKR